MKQSMYSCRIRSSWESQQTQEGFIQLDRRRGAVVAIDADKAQAMLKLREKLAILLAKGCCKNISREDVHALVDEIFDEYRR